MRSSESESEGEGGGSGENEGRGVGIGEGEDGEGGGGEGEGAAAAAAEPLTTDTRKRVAWEGDGAGGVRCETREYVVEHSALAAQVWRPTAHPTRPPRYSGGKRGRERASEGEAHDRGTHWADAERGALAALAGESPPAAPAPADGAYEATSGARRERRTAAGSTKRDHPADDAHATHAERHTPRSTAWAEVLVVFAGPGGDRDLPARLRARGIGVTAVDTKLGGAGHDVLRPEVGDTLLRRIRRGDFDAIFVATPCASYSVAHRPQLRSRRQPGGLADAPHNWRAYLAKHNELAR